ncbi:MAG: hypothetical protein V3W41_10755 [Planctomycetota bacterium]
MGEGPKVREAPVFGGGHENPWQQLEGVTAMSLRTEHDAQVVVALAENLKPEQKLRNWAGIVATEVELERGALLALFSDARRYADGPPFHLLLGPGEKIEALGRWRRQQSWRLDPLPDPELWIGVICLPGVSPALVERMKMLLTAPEWSRGGFATRSDLSSEAVLVEKSR